MGFRPLTLFIVAASLALVLAACETANTDDEVVEAADDSTVAMTDDTDADTSDDEEVEATDDSVTEAADDAGAEASDDEAVEDADVTSDATAMDLEEVEELLATAGFALCPADRSEPDPAHEGAIATIPDLDLVSMEADALDRTFEAEAYANTYVGEVTDDLFIGISLDSMYADQANGISVYTCDSDDISIYLTGEIEDGSSTLSDDSVEIDLTVADDEITGTVTVGSEDPQSFTATRPTDEGGLYHAMRIEGDVEILVRWIVLDDGRQRGDFICCPRPQPGSTQCWCCLYLP
jgi:hypothetical protein